MGKFKEFFAILEAGQLPADKKAIDVLTKQIAMIDKQIESKIGPTGQGPLIQKTGDNAGHINDQDPVFKALTAKRAMLVARRLKLTNKA
jgi:hypothetical protein